MRENKTVSNASSLAITALSVAIALGVMVIGFTGYNLVTYLSDRTSGMSNSAIAAEYKPYDGGRQNGETVMNVIEDAEMNPMKISVTVTTLRKDTTVYGYSNYEDDSYSGYNEDNPASSDYINPVGNFESTLSKSNGVVTGITFDQKN